MILMLHRFDTNIQDVYTACRTDIPRVWRLLWRRHDNNMLAHVAGVMEPEL